MNDLIGKKILILGGIQLACSVVELAKSMGLYTIVLDYNEDSPAKKIADKSYLVSTTDIDSVVDICRKEGVDGVFTSYIESMLPYCRMICDRLSLPFYATLEQIAITSNKDKFKALCRSNGVPIIRQYTLEQANTGEIEYPVFTKPVDNSGARGMSICYNENDLHQGYQKALNFSKSGTVLIEKYMDENCQCVNIDYLIVDGEFYLVGVGDKSVYRTEHSTAPITASVVYPSRYLQEYTETLNAKVVQMFKSIGIRNGYIFIESFYDEEGFHFYEMGFRIGGGQYYVMNSQIYHINFMELLLRYSITGKMLPKNATLPLQLSPDFSNKCCGLVILLSVGKIANISGLEEIAALDDVVGFSQLLFIGDELTSSDLGTLRQAFARVHIVSKSGTALSDTISLIYDLLSVSDTDGNNLVISNWK